MMRRRLTALLAALLILGAAATQASDGGALEAALASELNYVPGEVLVRFHTHAAPQARGLALARAGDPTSRSLGRDRMKIALAPGESVEHMVQQMLLDDAVEHAQPNYIYRAMTTAPNDPRFDQLWGLHNTGQSINGGGGTGTPGGDLGMLEAWAHTTDCSAVIVAVIDTGVNYTHVDLAQNMWDGTAHGYPHHGYDFFDNDLDPMPADGNGHGTHVAATIGAVGDNGIGITGVCWRAQIMALRAMNRWGGTTANLTLAVEFAVEHGAKIINMSLGGTGVDMIFQEVLRAARDKDVIVVAAAGNAGTDNDQAPVYPCSYDLENILCVAAMTQSTQRASFSNYGAGTVHVGAPGSNILSAWPGEPVSIPIHDGQWTTSGRWTPTNCDFGTGPKAMLTNPDDWCERGSYRPNANDVAYRTLNLGGYGGARIDLNAFIDLESGYDYFRVARRANGGNPFVGTGQLALSLTGRTWRNTAAALSIDMQSCLSASCTFGFRLQSDNTIHYEGVGLFDITLHPAEPHSTSYRYLNGTSMAAPHAAGVVAMVWAYNPQFTYRDALAAVMDGATPASALQGITVTGKTVSAIGALRHIAPPTNLQVRLP